MVPYHTSGDRCRCPRCESRQSPLKHVLQSNLLLLYVLSQINHAAWREEWTNCRSITEAADSIISQFQLSKWHWDDHVRCKDKCFLIKPQWTASRRRYHLPWHAPIRWTSRYYSTNVCEWFRLRNRLPRPRYPSRWTTTTPKCCPLSSRDWPMLSIWSFFAPKLRAAIGFRGFHSLCTVRAVLVPQQSLLGILQAIARELSGKHITGYHALDMMRLRASLLETKLLSVYVSLKIAYLSTEKRCSTW